MTRGGAEFWWGVELPKEVAYCIKEIGEDWKDVTYKEIFARKKARQDSRIYMKRAHGEVRPCAVWVFWNEPLWHMFFGGWWIYVRTLRGDYPLNFRNPRHDLVMQVKQMFPCGCLPFDEIYDEKWFEAFEKRFHYPGKRQRNAIAFCHCRFDERGRITEIIK
jgi:hypothetical protein